MADRWLRRLSGERPAHARLVCLPHAGGTAAAYAGWHTRLPATVELVRVQYPGRQDRLTERPIEDMAELADHVVAALLPLLDLPMALFGHSMGAAVCYEVARRLEAGAGFRMLRVFASARAAPHQVAGEPLSQLADEELLSAIRRLGGPHASLYDYPGLAAVILPSLRADLRLIDSYRPEQVTPLNTPITAFGGDNDETCPVEALSTWGDATCVSAAVRVFPGGHHYLGEREDDIVAVIANELADTSTRKGRRELSPPLCPLPAPEGALLNTVAADVLGDIALVIAVSSVLGVLARRYGQPVVIGQILTGVLLGPSVLGRFPGHLVNHLFPHQVQSYLAVLAQVAVAVFMFAVGYEIDLAKLRGRGRAVPLLAVGALAVPMGLGMACVLLFGSLFAGVGQVHQGRSFLLFIGVATSITAMPVLAAIVRERGLTGTVAGVTAAAASGCMDVVAWLLLAAALIESGRPGRLSLPTTLLLTGCFVAFMLVVVPRAVSWWTRRTTSILSDPVPLAFMLALGAAWVTSSLGLQAVFGGFLAGLAMRAAHREPDADVLRSLDQLGNLLLPLFFIVTGLSLNIGAVNGDGFALLALILAAAVAGKLGAAYGVSRACDIEPKESATVAVLVNTRGLTELIVLNVGLTDGLIGQQLFTVLVLMALITTMMTGPLLAVIGRYRAQEPAVAEHLTNT